MAGEKFIALEQTSQEIKTAVEGVNTSVTELKEDVGDSAGTDLVARVANLEAKVNSLQTTVESIPTSSDIATIVKNNAGGSVKIKSVLGSQTSDSRALALINSGVTKKIMFCCSGTGYFYIDGSDTYISINGGPNITLVRDHYLPKDTVLTIKNTGSRQAQVYGVGVLYEVV